MKRPNALANPQATIDDAVDALDRARMDSARAALSASGGNVSAAAVQVGVSRATFYRWIRRWAALGEVEKIRKEAARG